MLCGTVNLCAAPAPKWDTIQAARALKNCSERGVDQMAEKIPAEQRRDRSRSMTISRRDLLLAATASVGTLAVAACGGSPDPAAPAAPPPGAAPPPPAPPPVPPPAPIPTRVYSTNFDLTENPISEGGVWFNTGQLWTPVRTANGLAFGTNGATNTYDDSRHGFTAAAVRQARTVGWLVASVRYGNSIGDGN